MSQGREQRRVPAPPASSQAVSTRMRQQRRRDTEPELLVRKALFARGLRYRTHLPVPGAPRRTMDIGFPRRRIAVFIDGCFWHGCPEHGTTPQSNGSWWSSKIAENVERDAETARILADQGWQVLRFWEHDSVEEVADTVSSTLATNQQAPPSRP